MVAILIPVGALFLSFAILLMGNGLHATLLPVRAAIEGFSPLSIGMLGAVFYAGYIVACYAAPHVVARVGHIRSFAVFGTLASATSLAHALVINEAAWWVLRFATGGCLAGLYMIMESWINERAGQEHRGRILGVYQTVNMASVTVGQLLLTVADPAGFELFALASILVSVALVPVALTRTTAPKPLQQVRIRIPAVYAISPVGVIGCLTVGLVNGAIWTIVPLYAQATLPGVSDLAVFMSLLIVGGAVFQLPLGRWSDLVDRRLVIAVICLGAAAAAVALWLASGGPVPVLFGFAFLFGGFTFSLYAVAIAHANDKAGPEEFVEIASTLILVFSVGAVAGPLLGSAAVEAAGHAAFFLYAAAVHVLTAAFALYRTRRRAATPAEDKDAFVPVPRASPEVIHIDPRNPETGDGPDGSADAVDAPRGKPDNGGTNNQP